VKKIERRCLSDEGLAKKEVLNRPTNKYKLMKKGNGNQGISNIFSEE
jgi:hypothetical protein